MHRLAVVAQLLALVEQQERHALGILHPGFVPQRGIPIHGIEGVVHDLLLHLQRHEMRFRLGALVGEYHLIVQLADAQRLQVLHAGFVGALLDMPLHDLLQQFLEAPEHRILLLHRQRQQPVEETRHGRLLVLRQRIRQAHGRQQLLAAEAGNVVDAP